MKSQLLKDILKENMESFGFRYSQGRVYLLIFVLSYVACLAYFMFNKTDTMATIIDSVQWAILVFAAYVFGGKSIDTTKQIFKIKSGKDITTVVENISSIPADATNAPVVPDTTAPATADATPAVTTKESDLSS